MFSLPTNNPTPISITNGSLVALMLDQAQTFDAFTHQYSPTTKSATALMNNRYINLHRGEWVGYWNTWQ